MTKEKAPNVKEATEPLKGKATVTKEEDQPLNFIISLKPEIYKDEDFAFMAIVRAVITGVNASKAQKVRVLEYWLSKLQEEK